MQRFARLPNELLDSILSQLSGNYVKNLRLTSRAAARAVPLHLDRVFLSANPRDIEVFRAVADHDTFRSGVKEIIWDIALLENPLKSPKNQEMTTIRIQSRTLTVSSTTRSSLYATIAAMAFGATETQTQMQTQTQTQTHL
jgi:hypothetical protein